MHLTTKGIGVRLFKGGKKPSSFCKEDLRMTEVKAYDFLKSYFNDSTVLVAAIKKYHEMSKVTGWEILICRCSVRDRLQ